jgi:NSS family neurotransmitter:Na+ symporter|tara:strand:- start:2 stop:1408 length:1407 start_codon:yes stop_codon:yes gene_type:complete
MNTPSGNNRGQWGSRLGFILAASGSAVGLGNIWRFPYVTGENGGAAFVFVYLLCVFLIGLPLLYVELSLGRASQRNPIDAFKVTRPGSPFFLTGFICLAACFVVLTYYGVIAGWTIGYFISQITQTTLEFTEYTANPVSVLPVFAIFIVATVYIVSAGVEKGIEKWSKVLMPLLFFLIFVIIIRSLTLEGASKGLAYYLDPDFSKIDEKVVLMALGQAFFSLSVGWGLMITYGSYIPKTQNIVTSGFWVAIADTGVAILGGLMVFPAVFAFGMDPGSGPGLTFVTLPAVFAEMPAGWIIGAIFFLLLSVAALTSSISMLEVPVSYFVDKDKGSRKVSAILVGIFAFIVGIPSALSNGASSYLTNFELFGKTGFMDILDQVFGTLCLIVIALLLSLYVGWVWKPKNAVKEIEVGCPWFTKPFAGPISLASVWTVFVKYICPIVILLVLLNTLGVDLFGNAAAAEAAKPE